MHLLCPSSWQETSSQEDIVEYQRFTSKKNRVFYPLIIIGLWCLVFGLSMLFPQGRADAAQITLAWDVSDGAAGYKIYSGTTSNNYTWVADVGNATSYTTANLTDGYTYHFAATAYDASGLESDYSAEISYNASIVPCSYSISPASASLNTSGGSGSISVTTQSGCAWSASSGASWITITSGSSGTGSGTVAYSVTSNSGAARSVVSTIAGQLFTFNQSGTQSYTLTVGTSGTGTGTVTKNPTGTSFSSGTVVTLTATANASSTFTGWSGACSGTATTCQVTMNANTNVGATFALRSYAITASAGTGGSISPSGSVNVTSGASQTYTITPSSGYAVSSVTVDGASVGAVTSYAFSNVTVNHTIAATFTPATSSYTLTVTRSGTGTGTVTTSPTGTNFAAGTVVTLTVAANASSTFTGWSGACSGTATTCQVTMNANKSVGATFVLRSYTINASVSRTGGTISPSGSVNVTSGSSQTYTITPQSGYKIWFIVIDGQYYSARTSYIFTNVQAQHTIKAYFSR
jgi:hypothetical protein